jgi:hypothetical protein
MRKVTVSCALGVDTGLGNTSWEGVQSAQLRNKIAAEAGEDVPDGDMIWTAARITIHTINADRGGLL